MERNRTVCGLTMDNGLVARELPVLRENCVYTGANAFVRNGGTLVELGKTVYA